MLTDSADHGQKNSPRQSLPRHVDSLSSLSVAETVGRFPRGSENWRWSLGRTQGAPLVSLGPAGPSRELKFTLRPLRAQGRLPPAPPSQLRVAAGPRSANPSRSSLWGYASRSVSSFLALWLSAAQIAPQLTRLRLPAARPGGSQRSGAGASGGWAALQRGWAALRTGPPTPGFPRTTADDLSVPLLELRAAARANPAAPVDVFRLLWRVLR